MGNPKLTIAIPTYNRAEKLNSQLEWAVHSIENHWGDCELIVSDNASPDATQEVCNKWFQQSGNRLRIIRQSSNIGLIQNALFCIQEAQGDFVWIVSDDDIILNDTFLWVLEQSRSSSPTQLGYILLNFSTRNGYSGEILQERFYQFLQDRYSLPGITLFEECATLDEGGVMALTANIYSSQIARAAIAYWPAITRNLAFPLFLSGYTSALGGMIVRAEPSLVYPHHTGSHLKSWLNTLFHDIPVAYWALRNLGFSPGFIRRNILMRASFLAYAARFPIQFMKSLQVYFRASRMKDS